jgi:hypothetical protein
MAVAKKTARGRKQDRARMAGGQNCEVRHESKKTGKNAFKKVGNARKRVESPRPLRATCRVARRRPIPVDTPGRYRQSSLGLR